MNLVRIKAFPGRNIYAHFPVIKVELDLEGYVDIPTCDIEGFNEKLLVLLPGLYRHECGGKENGFIGRLERGTYLAHVMEHIALEIQNLLGYDIGFGKTRYLEGDTIYGIVYGYIDEVAGFRSAKLAFDIIQSLICGDSIDLEEELRKIKIEINKEALGLSTAAIVTEARKRDIPVMRIGSNSLIQLGYGKYARRIQATITDNTNCIAVDAAGDKELTNRILRMHGIPVPIGSGATGYDEVKDIVMDIGYPVVVKPYNGNQGRGVSLNLKTLREVKKAFMIAKKFSNRVLVEKYIPGRHYRVAVVDEKVVAVSERIAAHVIGNGRNTIDELIKIENQNPLRGVGHEKPLTQIRVDDIMLLFLKKTGKTLNEIPAKGETVFLRENDNLSTGGIAIDVTDEIHPDNAKMAINAARAIGLDVAGVDITISDIGKSVKEVGGGVIEINACPGIRMHHYPFKGKKRNVAAAIVDSLFPMGQEHSAQIISVTGTNGKTTICRMLAKILQAGGQTVGMTTTGGVYVEDEKIIEGDTTGPKSAQAILMDKRVDVAVLETARGGIVNKGLGYEKADIAILTNISDDHLGIDGINTLEEMANIKALIAESVKKQGYVVLNGDDDYIVKMAERVKSEIIYFTKNPDNLIMKKHRSLHGKLIYLKDGTIFIFDGKKDIPVITVREIPATLEGILTHNIENSMAAIAGAYSYGVNIGDIYSALNKFDTGIKNNPGRFNLFHMGDFKVVLDYGHNIEGYRKVLDGLEKIKENRLIGIIGMPGDRSDISIMKVGEISGKHFDYVYIKEDKNPRGRKSGQVADLLKSGCSLGGMKNNCMEIKLCEVKALRKAMKNAKMGDIILVFYEEYGPLVKEIEDFKEKTNILSNKMISDMPIKNQVAHYSP